MSLPLPLQSWPRSSWCDLAAFSLMPGGPYSNDTIPCFHPHRGRDIRDHGTRTERHLGLVWRLRSRLLRLCRVGRLHDPRPHYWSTDPTCTIHTGITVAVPACSAWFCGFLGAYGSHRRPDCTPASAWNLFLHRHVRSGLCPVCPGWSICTPVRRVQRAVWSVQSDGRRPWPRLSVLPVFLPRFLRVHLHPRLY